MKEFWSKARLNKLDKILIYEALICSKTTYAMEVLPIPQTEYERMDAEYLKGYRQIFGLKTTYAQKQDGGDMTNTNKIIIELVNEALSQAKKQRRYCSISTIIKRRAEKIFGEALRKHWSDPIGQVVSGYHRTRQRPWNVTYKGECLPWRPRSNWIVDTARRVWDRNCLYTQLPAHQQRYSPSDRERPSGTNVEDFKTSIGFSSRMSECS